MRTNLRITLLAGLISSMLAGCSDGGSQDTAAGASQKQISASAKSSVPVCAAAWDTTVAYNTGNIASYSSVNYTANWWTQGANPSTSNGVTGSGQPWTSGGACTPTPTP